MFEEEKHLDSSKDEINFIEVKVEYAYEFFMLLKKYDYLQKRFIKDNPKENGLFDLNRY